MAYDKPHYFVRCAEYPHVFDYPWGLTETYYREIYFWCQTNLSGKWYYNAGTIRIAEDDDAFNFRLRWC